MTASLGTIRSTNPFCAIYSGDDAFLADLVAALESPVVKGVRFPSYPPEHVQLKIHGCSGVLAIRQAFDFYRACRRHAGQFHGHLLDFGSGWGRMVRPFLPHFELLNIVGYEPNADLCRTARELNPYVHFVNGGYWPPSPFADSAFDFVTAWSVFSHLPANLAAAWLSEFARICRPAARIFVTSRGERYLDALERAVDCAWSKRMIERIGDLKEARARYRAGEFLWFPETDDYGEAFIPKEAMRALLPPSMEIIAADCSLSQMTFVIQKS